MRTLVLFDFDGTLADTAPDLAAAANLQATRAGLAPAPYAALRAVASQGARGLLQVALGVTPIDDSYEDHRKQFLCDYASSSTLNSRLFDGIAPLLDSLTARNIAWGIVTNKLAYLAEPIVAHLGLMAACATLVCGDTTAHAKPHPLPLLHAADQAGYAAEDCIYVGDDLRDIQAAHAAGMPAIAAAYGYLDENAKVTQWLAEAQANTPTDLLPAIEALMAHRVQTATNGNAARVKHPGPI